LPAAFRLSLFTLVNGYFLTTNTMPGRHHQNLQLKSVNYKAESLKVLHELRHVFCSEAELTPARLTD